MFYPYQYLDGQPDPWELQPAAAGLTLKAGQALAQAGGKLAVAAGTTKPQFICMCDTQAETEDGQMIPVIRVSGDTIYETELSEDSASIAAGAAYTIDEGGEKITATAASGVAKVVSFDGTAAGDKVRVTF